MPTLKSWHSASETEKGSPIVKRPGGPLERELFDDAEVMVRPVESQDTTIDEEKGMDVGVAVTEGEGTCESCKRLKRVR